MALIFSTFLSGPRSPSCSTPVYVPNMPQMHPKQKKFMWTSSSKLFVHMICAGLLTCPKDAYKNRDQHCCYFRGNTPIFSSLLFWISLLLVIARKEFVGFFWEFPFSQQFQEKKTFSLMGFSVLLTKDKDKNISVLHLYIEWVVRQGREETQNPLFITSQLAPLRRCCDLTSSHRPPPQLGRAP